MPITSSAKKALRASKHKRVFNIHRRDVVTALTKNFRKLVSEKKVRDAEKLLPSVFQAIDKAAKTGFIKKNAASRKKSRLSALIKKSA